MSYRPRIVRIDDLRRRAMAHAQADGCSAIQLAEAAIEAVFGTHAWAVNDLKRRAEHWIKCGPRYPGTRARFADLAYDLILPDDLTAAIGCIRQEMARFRRAEARRRVYGSTCRETPERLREALLIMRWLRAKGWALAWPVILQSLDPDIRISSPALQAVETGALMVEAAQ